MVMDDKGGRVTGVWVEGRGTPEGVGLEWAEGVGEGAVPGRADSWSVPTRVPWNVRLLPPESRWDMLVDHPGWGWAEGF